MFRPLPLEDATDISLCTVCLKYGDETVHTVRNMNGRVRSSRPANALAELRNHVGAMLRLQITGRSFFRMFHRKHSSRTKLPQIVSFRKPRQRDSAVVASKIDRPKCLRPVHYCMFGRSTIAFEIDAFVFACLVSRYWSWLVGDSILRVVYGYGVQSRIG